MQVKAQGLNPPALRELVNETFDGEVKIVDAYPRVPDWDYTTNVWIGMMLRPAESSHPTYPRKGDEYRRYGHRGRALYAVNWRCHAEFLRALFEKFPDARVRTSSPRGKFTIVADQSDWHRMQYPAGKGHSTMYLSDWLSYSASIIRD